LRIGFLQPWQNSAENQAFSSLSIAAGRTGHELLYCRNSADVEAQSPDFVLASGPTQPKLNDRPHYGVIHAPKDIYLTNREVYDNLLTYDGYLTIADSLERFLRDLNYGIGRSSIPIGFYYNTCQRQNESSDLRGLINGHDLRITYFGTNWDFRRQKFFRELSKNDRVQIFGPKESWRHIHNKSYAGTVPFDGVSVQKKYALNGIGLCILANSHLQEDIISNRIFEITSIGAIALCCDIPWIRKNYGDSVYYFDQNLPDRDLVNAILQLRELVYKNPEIAIEKASQAKRIFDNKFAAEIMIDNAVNYHSMISAYRLNSIRRVEEQYSPFVSVIIRCGSRPIEYAERAVKSISRQSFGQFEVLLVRHKNELDLSPFVQTAFQRIRSIRVVDCIGGNRSATLWTGLKAVRGDFFSVLDDDDWWFSDHFEKLFVPTMKNLSSRPSRYFAYSGNISVNREGRNIAGKRGKVAENRLLFSFGIRSSPRYYDVSSAFASNCFVASSDLLSADLLVDPEMNTAEDSCLILSLLNLIEGDPKFSFAATSVFDRTSSQQSNFLNDPGRRNDELTLLLRLNGQYKQISRPADGWGTLAEFWSRQRAATKITRLRTSDARFAMLETARELTAKLIVLVRDPEKRNRALSVIYHYFDNSN
jgi:hypothetical protein